MTLAKCTVQSIFQPPVSSISAKFHYYLNRCLDWSLLEGVPEERRILNKVEDSRSYLTDHAVQALLPALPLRQGRQVWPPSRQAEMVVPALRISVHQPVSRRGGR